MTAKVVTEPICERQANQQIDMVHHEPVGLLTRTYFRMKPLIPGWIRWAMRRGQVNRILRKSSHHWPVDERAAKKPDGWTGWPEKKRFALVLTHDVESASGVANVKSLANVEQEYGFRSSFNFIPEGPYPDPSRLRSWLRENGFEVGVHDLRHDGHLFASRRQFIKDAKRINHHLKNWGASGFRSGFMLRDLSWLHDLNLLYDASTFDTDPFEPQPAGVGTIFPFLVKPAGGHSPGYVELPYTLPQDSTLFLLLQEQSPIIWIRKLDWIARNGGLALVNIHPDYIHFSKEGESKRSYSISLVEDWLSHVRERYKDDFWNPLPRDLATWCRGRVNDNTSSEIVAKQ